MLIKRSVFQFITTITSLLVLLGQLEAAALPEVNQYNHTVYAACRMKHSHGLGDNLPRVSGHVLFRQEYPDGALNAFFYITGFPVSVAADPLSDVAADPRALHVHQYGDIAKGCGATGGHYNPHGAPHPRHPGDFGNFPVVQGMIEGEGEYPNATLFGPLSVLGRAVVLHQQADDLGLGGNEASLLHGNAGTRLACCVIGISSDALWNKYRT